jgi:ABC-type transport system substrate-binding protein
MKDTTKCSPVPMNPASVGWVPDPGYPYDPAKARQLLDAVLGAGKGMDIDVYYETGDIPSTWVDALISYWNDVGIRAKFNPVEGARNDEARLPGPNGIPVDSYMLPGHTNDLFDASVPLAYLDCTVENSFSACDPQFQKDRAAASALSGDERKTAMEAMVRKYVIESAQFNGLWLTPYIFGASDRLVWPNPQMLKIRPDQMSFNGS